MQAPRRVAFISTHCAIDFTNDAAVATLDGLELLAALGFDCQVFCSTHLDAREELLIEEILANSQIRYQVRNMQIGQGKGRMIFAQRGRTRITMFNTASTRGGWISHAEIESFLTACDTFLRANRPDVVWTYGGDDVSMAVQALVKRLGIPIVFAVHNINYGNVCPFERAQHVIVPSEFTRRFYWEVLQLTCHTLPPVIDCNRALCQDRDAKFVTFVNPKPTKGVLFLVRIAYELARRRPDIRFLVVEASARFADLSKLYGPLLGTEIVNYLRDPKNVAVMPNVAKAKQFYRTTRILLMPSMMETAGLVAAEAMMNGIPVIASNRGGLPETIGEAGILLDIPSQYTPETIALPEAAEAGPWITEIERLWDDAAEYERLQQAGLKHAKMWSPERMGPIYREFFGGIAHQPGPPRVPK